MKPSERFLLAVFWWTLFRRLLTWMEGGMRRKE